MDRKGFYRLLEIRKGRDEGWSPYFCGSCERLIGKVAEIGGPVRARILGNRVIVDDPW